MTITGKLWSSVGLGTKFSLLFALLSVAVVSVYVFLVVSPQWEARAIVQVARVGQNPVEPSARSAERMKGREFIDSVLLSMGVSDRDDRVARLVHGSLRIQQLANTDLLDVRVRAYSPKQALDFADMFVRKLAALHAAMAEPVISRLKANQGEADRTMERLSKERDIFWNVVAGRGPENPTSATLMALATFQISVVEKSLAEATERVNILKEQLHSAQTFPSSTIEPISVSARPVVPHIALSLGIAALIGGVSGFLFAGTRLSRAVGSDGVSDADHA